MNSIKSLITETEKELKELKLFNLKGGLNDGKFHELNIKLKTLKQCQTIVEKDKDKLKSQAVKE